MNGRELHKIAASILIAALIIMITGKIVDFIYHPNLSPDRGYSVKVDESGGQEVAPPQEEKFEIDIKTAMQSASSDLGKVLFTKCAACHSPDKGGPNRVGPHLWDVVGRPKATSEGYSYSSALKALGGEWDYDSLAHFLHKPSAYAKGTKMSFAGFKKQEDIANIIAYLRSLSDSPKPLP
ncbi:MAG: cytochrome c family protein [Alphaproteobacteria bacterium]|nr:cytochrome c family protein [Alphaproteobacteria bacterium]